ncbi:hypothetical protein GLOTRDRAFT_76881 [Gloeophyllum trabeum ATCC 11539]|uniref:Protein-S-isoprenylcysteine O-methyltransferase n=1 Tax=Gloeophyllum trabeum (strain ATCC 11539 / FP-39264 / Madison 617) TaxID=670483 RepID=S7RNP8_GLOTA|nr:uncharacterized protein GLOTRDRAFT_76881 [Gloeophyllum trabeum ATCC 11539]EPQ54399.1 hypothetical protein GLOTRDRAFT_76881 [Gloeophyllum trabeum ATCC 11539]
MSLLRLPLLFVTAAGVHISMTNPNPPVSLDETQKYSVTQRRRPSQFVLWWPRMLKYSYWALGLSETAVILASQFPRPPLTERLLSSLVVRPSSHISAVQVTPHFLAGLFLATAGTILRVECYRTLGRLFTYQVSIRKEHQLVTSGPYSLVRHPAYTAGWLVYSGVNLCMFGPGSWLRECGWLDTVMGQTLLGTVIAVGFIVSGFMIYRTRLEDVLLKNQFGEQWDAWARRVPYRLIPFIY